MAEIGREAQLRRLRRPRKLNTALQAAPITLSGRRPSITACVAAPNPMRRALVRLHQRLAEAIRGKRDYQCHIRDQRERNESRHRTTIKTSGAWHNWLRPFYDSFDSIADV